MPFVTASRGTRDGFHLPIALARAGLLSRHITDFAGFAPNDFRRRLTGLMPQLGRRVAPDLPKNKLRSMLAIAIRELLPTASWEDEVRRIDANDSRFAKEALRVAIEEKAHLFLYHPYAYEAFAAPEARDRIKVLHQYHPHPDYERKILEQDRNRSGIDFQQREYAEILSPDRLRRWTGALELADHVVCPSSVVADSIGSSGGDRIPSVSIIPYGAESDAEFPRGVQGAGRGGAKPFALFVGNGIQRKGIHWLLKAWDQSGTLGRDLDLVLVTRKIDPALGRHFRLDRPGLRICKDLTREELDHLMCRAEFLVNPSLLEGFGHVYLEALSRGTPVVGSRNSFLADLEPTGDVMMWDPEMPESLTSILEIAVQRYAGRPEGDGLPCAGVKNHTWPVFHERIARAAAIMLEAHRSGSHS